MTNKLLSSLRFLLYKPRHYKEAARITEWEMLLLFSNQSYRDQRRWG